LRDVDECNREVDEHAISVWKGFEIPATLGNAFGILVTSCHHALGSP
jgi:hypothetical protein